MNSKTSITKTEVENTTSTIHAPFEYDYIDFSGELDLRNHFVTKLTATGSGQCNSLPILYMILAQELGAKAYISYAPQHSFIKYPDSTGAIIGYEPTNGWHINDQYYRDDLHITIAAERNKLYLDTVGYKRMVASALLDLSIGYGYRNGIGAEDFHKNCIKTADKYFGGSNYNLQGLLIKSMIASAKLNREIRNAKLDSKNPKTWNTKAKKHHAEVVRLETIISALGYKEIPQLAYESMIARHKEKGKIQISRNKNLKEPRSMFREVQK